jgi:hypothetical protein
MVGRKDSQEVVDVVKLVCSRLSDPLWEVSLAVGGKILALTFVL